MCSNLLLQLRYGAPHNTSSDQSLCFFCPAQDEILQALIFLHLSLCLLTRETSRERQKNSCKIKKHQSINIKGSEGGRSTWPVELKGCLTFFSLLALSWTCSAVWRCSSVSLATASPSCLHSRGFCSPNSCTDTPNSARERLQHSHSSQKACKNREEQSKKS